MANSENSVPGCVLPENKGERESLSGYFAKCLLSDSLSPFELLPLPGGGNPRPMDICKISIGRGLLLNGSLRSGRNVPCQISAKYPTRGVPSGTKKAGGAAPAGMDGFRSGLESVNYFEAFGIVLSFALTARSVSLDGLSMFMVPSMLTRRRSVKLPSICIMPDIIFAIFSPPIWVMTSIR